MKKLWILAGIVSFSLGIILIAGCTKKTLWMTEGAVSVEQSAEMTSGMEHKTAGTGVTQDTGTVMAGPESSEGVQGKPANGRLAADDAVAKTTPPKGTYRFRNIHFAFDRYDLSPEARDILRNHAKRLLKEETYTLVIEGHCDERGTTEYNLALGQRRALEAMRYLTDLGVEPGRIKTISYGEEMPLHDGHNEAAWAANRRGHFVVTLQN